MSAAHDRPSFGTPLGTLALVLAAAMAAAPPVDARQTIAPKTVFAAVVDGAGKPLGDLAKTDWAVREDGADRSIVDVKPSTETIELVILVDTTKWIQNYVTDIRAALLTFVRAIKTGQPDADIAIMGFGRSATSLVPITKAQPDLEKAIQRLFPDQDDTAVLLEALVDASKTLGKTASTRRAIVTLNLESTPEVSQTAPQNVANAVFAAGASLWAVSFRTSATTNASQARDIILNNLTTQSGGARLTVGAGNAVETAMKQIADVILAQYTVTFSRPEGAASKVLQLAVARPGAHVLASRNAPR